MTHVDHTGHRVARGQRGAAATHLQQAVSAAPQPRGRGLSNHGLRLFRGTLHNAHRRTHAHRCEPHVNIHRQADPDVKAPVCFILFACRMYISHVAYTRLEHRCQTLAHSVSVFDLPSNTKSPLELLARRYETAHVAPMAQNPECPADTLAQGVHRRTL